MSLRSIAVLLAAGLLCAASAPAGLFEDLYRAIDRYYVTPTGSPVSPAPGGGLSNGSRFGRLRIVPNRLGDGYRLELDRAFGADRTGRPEVFDLGNLELELSGNTQATIGFTRRFIPTFDARLRAGTLSYQLRGTTGGQDFVLLGQIDADQAIQFNALGFYAVNLTINNVDSRLVGEGLGVEGNVDTSFDVGPITIRGHILADALLALATSLGINTEDAEALFPKSPIDRINDEIESALRQNPVLGEAVITGWEVAPAATRTSSSDEPGSADAAALAVDPALVPEPPSLALLALGLAALFRR